MWTVKSGYILGARSAMTEATAVVMKNHTITLLAAVVEPGAGIILETS